MRFKVPVLLMTVALLAFQPQTIYSVLSIPLCIVAMCGVTMGTLGHGHFHFATYPLEHTLIWTQYFAF